MRPVTRNFAFRNCQCFRSSERNQVVVEWNRTESPVFPTQRRGGIPAYFKEQYQRTPDSVALIEGGRRLTYRELEERSNRLANYIQKLGAKKGTRVACCIDRSLDTTVCLLGILKTGAAYVPFDPSHPTDRLAFLLEDSDPIMLITQEKLLGGAPRMRRHDL